VIDAPRALAGELDALADARELISACAWPSEAYWRLLELAAVRSHTAAIAAPVLELGCGDGAFTQLTGLTVDLAVDREARAVARASSRRSVYRAVHRTDIRELDTDLGPFGTIFSNSVLEHVVNLGPVLSRCRELLAPGGRLIATVPLSQMNEHLAVRAPAYAHARQHQLQHRNLWSVGEWQERLEAAGFASVSADLYLDGAACRRWDRLDFAGALGMGRYRVAPVLHRLASTVLPTRVKQPVREWIVGRLLDWTQRPARGPGCAAVLVAVTPG
jgi:SAM-dependent methyltransferase